MTLALKLKKKRKIRPPHSPDLFLVLLAFAFWFMSFNREFSFAVRYVLFSAGMFCCYRLKRYDPYPINIQPSWWKHRDPITNEWLLLLFDFLLAALGYLGAMYYSVKMWQWFLDLFRK